jgi:type I restriction enzyme S subunit
LSDESVPYGYKNTVIGIIPENWQIKYISDLFNVKNGTTPSTKEIKYWSDEQINWVTPADLNKLNGKKFISRSSRMISENALNDCNLTLMPVDSLIMSTRAPVGYISLVQNETTFNQGCKGLIPKNNNISSYFYLYYLLKSKEKLQSISGGSTFQELATPSLNKFHVPLPPLLEQQKIASILTKVDEQISFTESIIEKTDELKKGMMQQLLTKGIGHTKFKKTEIGEIPEEWDVVRLENVIKSLDAGVSVNSESRPAEEGECGILKTSCAYDGYFNPDENKAIVSVKELSRAMTTPKKDSIIISRMNTPNLVGQCGYVDKDYPSLFLPDRLWQTSFYSDVTTSVKFVSYLLNSTRMRKIISNSATGTSGTMKNISKKFILSIHIVYPSLPEQQKIASILSKVDNQITHNKNYLSNLQELKKGLMQDLLTGKVRVKVG